MIINDVEDVTASGRRQETWSEVTEKNSHNEQQRTEDARDRWI